MRLFRVSDDQNEPSSSLFVAFREDEEAVIRDQKFQEEKRPRAHVVVRCRGHGCIWRFEIHVERSWNNPSLQGRKIGCNYAYESSVSIVPRVFRSNFEEREPLLAPSDVKLDKEEFPCLPPYLSSFNNDFMQHLFRNFLHMHKVSPNRRCLNQLNS